MAITVEQLHDDPDAEGDGPGTRRRERPPDLNHQGIAASSASAGVLRRSPRTSCCWGSKRPSRSRQPARKIERASPDRRQAAGPPKCAANASSSSRNCHRHRGPYLSVCRNDLHRTGEEVSERLDIIPAQLRVIVVARPKYACRACQDVVVRAPAPARRKYYGSRSRVTGQRND
ncbi:hypothetical protein C1D09_015380 [Mesorhizobium intechi]|nr:hypothetical protein C1D09_015380 [Mesorhizobium intechi]